jgi:hypothetical protein
MTNGSSTTDFDAPSADLIEAGGDGRRNRHNKGEMMKLSIPGEENEKSCAICIFKNTDPINEPCASCHLSGYRLNEDLDTITGENCNSCRYYYLHEAHEPCRSCELSHFKKA